MRDATVNILYRPADRDWARRVSDLLSGALRRVGTDAPGIELHEGIEHFAVALSSISPVSVVLLVLPQQRFSTEEVRLISDFQRRPGGRDQILPLSCDAQRDRPHTPLDALKSYPLHVLDDPTINRLVRWLMIQLGLRVACRARSIFISYRAADGTAVAKRLETLLEQRGYRVFRDEKSDEDDLPLIRYGSSVQKRIKEEIEKHGLLLLVDTPASLDSEWVLAEVRYAVASMRPMLPIVVENPPTSDGRPGAPVALGGRFSAMREMQRDVRLARSMHR